MKNWFRLPFGLGQIGLALAAVVVVLVMVDFNQQLAAWQRTNEDKNVLETEVARLEREQAALKTQIAYATTDAAVVEWAHEQGKLVLPGEVIVVPVAPPGATSVPEAVRTAAAPTVSNWELWLGLFVDLPGREGAFQLLGPVGVD